MNVDLRKYPCEKCPPAESEAINLNFHCEIWICVRTNGECEPARFNAIGHNHLIIYCVKNESDGFERRGSNLRPVEYYGVPLNNKQKHCPSIGLFCVVSLALCVCVNSCIIWQFHLCFVIFVLVRSCWFSGERMSNRMKWTYSPPSTSHNPNVFLVRHCNITYLSACQFHSLRHTIYTTCIVVFVVSFFPLSDLMPLLFSLRCLLYLRCLLSLSVCVRFFFAPNACLEFVFILLEATNINWAVR